MKMNLRRFILAAITICFGSIASLHAQETTGSIVGTVKDANGAAVAGATVTATIPSQDNVVIRTVTTNDEGNYSIPNVPVNVYSITVEAPNFKKVIQTDVKIDVGQRRPVDIVLEPGGVNETVTVAADAVAVELSTPTAGTTISGDQVREIPINNRNFIQLVTLAPGVSSNLADQVYVGNTNPEGQPNIIAISVNGARQSQNTMTVDGADIVDRGANITIQAFPSVDSIGEFKVLRALYPAESGRSGGGQINVVTRSGTDEFHGSFFEFVRNEKLNANTFFNNRSGIEKPPFRYNNYGFTVGGPVWFFNVTPNSNDGLFQKLPKTYFFFSEEQRKDRRFITLVGTVPTDEVLQGIFPVPICLSGTITAGVGTCNQVLPAGQAFSTMATVNPVAQQYINQFYTNTARPNDPNPALPYTVRTPASGIVDFRQEIFRIDTSITEKLSMYFRYQRDEIPSLEANGLNSTGSGIPNFSTTETNAPGRAYTFNSTYVVSPNVIIEGQYNYAYGAIITTPTGLMARENFPGLDIPLPYPVTTTIVPFITDFGFSNLQSFSNWDNFSNKHAWSGSLTWISGSHTMKYGGTYSKYRKHENRLGGSNQGTFNNFFNTTAASPTQGMVCAGVATCPTSGEQFNLQRYANFLLGTNVGFTQSKFDLTADFRQQNFEAYAQDEYRMRRNLSLYIGVRYSYFGSPWDAGGLLSNFDPAAYVQSEAPTVTLLSNGNSLRTGGNFCNGIIVNAQNYQTGPAIYNCTPTSSPFGKYVVDAEKLNFAPRIGIAWDPFGKGTTAVRTGYGIYHDQNLVGTLENHLGTNPPYQETITLTSGTTLADPVPSSGSTVVFSPNVPNSVRGVQTDYLTPYMQHWSLDIQHQLTRSTVIDVGYYGSKGTHLIGVVDLNNLRPGDAASKTCKNAAGTSVPCQATNATTNLPIPFTAQANILDQIRPYQGWRSIFMIQPKFNSNYHSLQVSATQRFTGASQIQLAYTWAKNLTDNQTDRSTATQDVYNSAGDYGRAQLDRRHVLTVNYIYELPFFAKQQGFVGKALGGWQVSGIVTYQTGLPFTPTFASYDPAGIGFLGPSPAGGRPFIFGDPNVGGAQTQAQWFNTSVFQSTRPTSAAAIPGDASRGVINGPPTFRVDFTLNKNFRISDSMRLQLRAEAFNAFNHTNFSSIAVVASTLSTFGTVTAARDPRTIQLGIKFSY